MTWSKRLSPPLWARILAIVVGALVAAQLVTLALTVFFPPEPPRQYSLTDIGAALRGSTTAREHERPLVLSFEDGAPSLQSPGWVVSAPATRDLAKLVGATEADVRLLFYAPPPLAGGAPMPPPPQASAGQTPFSLHMPQVGQAGGAAGPGGPHPGGMMPGGPGARPGPGAGAPPSGANFPGGAFPGSRLPASRAPASSQPPFVRAPSASPVQSPMNAPARMPGNVPPGGARMEPGRAPVPSQPFTGPPRGPIIRSPLDAAVFARPIARSTPPVETTADTTPPPAPVPIAQAPAAEPPVTTPTRIEPLRPAVDPELKTIPRTALATTPSPAHSVTEHTLAPPSVSAGFRLGQAPYVEGEFVAAVRMSDGRWATVRPRPEGFFNSWQRRVLLWFSLSVALITPLALFVAWRLAAPLKVFAESADRLGREPSADLPPLTGPAEIGKAADAFNLMQQRLKRYVEDRTGMIRAISHDLRTPLTRIRFKLERASPSLREAIGRDMDQMEEMIASVLSFMRDEANVAPRQIVDLRSLVEVVVDDAQGPAELEPGPAVLVEIDVVGVQRVVENLVDNAVKYGGRARVSLAVHEGEAFVAVADEGPGLPANELDQVFKPFYRSAAARASGRSGVGLGLSVSRATMRAHGGDLNLRSGEPGLVAELRLPQAAAARMAA